MRSPRTTKPKNAEHPRDNSSFYTVHPTWDTETNVMREPIMTVFLWPHDVMTDQNET